jgi:hypothetical protein
MFPLSILGLSKVKQFSRLFKKGILGNRISSIWLIQLTTSPKDLGFTTG